jgi:hypothetical protein
MDLAWSSILLNILQYVRIVTDGRSSPPANSIPIDVFLGFTESPDRTHACERGSKLLEDGAFGNAFETLNLSRPGKISTRHEQGNAE